MTARVQAAHSVQTPARQGRRSPRSLTEHTGGSNDFPLGDTLALSITEFCRRHGISAANYYKWKQKFGGLEVKDARRLRLLEEENRKLKKLVADQALDNMVLKELLGKKSSSPKRDAPS